MFHFYSEYFTSDVGTLLYLRDKKQPNDNQRYFITSYTPGFASQELMKAVKDQIPLTRQQLMNEDKY